MISHKIKKKPENRSSNTSRSESFSMGDGSVQYSAKLKVLSETGLVIGSGVGMTGKEVVVGGGGGGTLTKLVKNLLLENQPNSFVIGGG